MTADLSRADLSRACRGAKFTKAHQPVELVYTEEYEDDSQ